ncbi:tetratricopeptide repeat protein [Rubellimicrobium roseum]|uniref:Tetratricopeptide repeat protein n=1 Tax=Rubellimicrobium roseum TaxID=687525 RepID=A0A5C4NLH0_9RHOB|nr:tetratricopeptide repeat protein [Rubellimicrobium roseum]TNC74228.1 tetratricopeptide repeat protein [Rubellimicrobium roseum]
MTIAAEDDLTALRSHAIAAHRAGRRAEALPLYAAVLARAPDDAGIWTNLGALLRAEGHYDQARRAQERAFALDPTAPGVLNNLANILNDLGEHERSLALRREIMRAAPHDPNHLAMAGKSLRSLGRLDEGIELLEDGVRRFPAHAEMKIQLALTQLAARRYGAGFGHYAARWETGELAPRRIEAPKWDGGPIEGRTILVLPEQGFGDALCFARFLPILRHIEPASVLLLSENPLLRLMQGVEGADRVASSMRADEFDVWVDMMDLPIIHFAVDDAVPPPTRLSIPEDSRARARGIVAPFRDRLKVGVVWCGSVTYRANAFRSFPHTELHALLDLPGLQLFSLYKGPELAAFQADGTSAFIVDAGSTDRDFADCAALMEEMDLIVTSDTVTAHLAGSLGRPVWTLLHWDAFWLWGPKGDTTPWYPSMRLIRQDRPRDWSGVLGRVRADLAARLQGHVP